MAKKKTGRPKKPALKRKGSYLQVRVTEGESATYDLAAEVAGLDKSAWVRERLRAIVRKELESAGMEVPFLTG